MRVLATLVAAVAIATGLVPAAAHAAGSSPVDRTFVATIEQTIASATPILLTNYAAGDGTTPAGAAINRAIADAAASGRPILAPAGLTFLVDEVLLLRSGTTIMGGATFRAARALGDRPVMLNADFLGGNERIALIGIEIDAARATRGNPGGTAHGIWLHGGDDAPVRQVLLRDVEVHGAPMLGVPMQNVQDAVIERLESHDHGRDGLTFYWNTRRVEIVAPHIYDCGDDLIGINGEDGTSNGHRLEDITITSPRLGDQRHQGSAIAVHGARRVTVRDAVIEGSFHAALSVGNWNRTPSSDVLVDGLTATEPGRHHAGGAGHGIEMYAGAANRSLAGSAGVDHVTLRRIDIQRPRAQGVALFGARGAEIDDVSIQGRIRGGSPYPHSRGVTTSTGFVNRLRLELDVRDMPAEGLWLHGGEVPMRDLMITGTTVADNGRARPSTGIDIEHVEGLTIANTTSTGHNVGIRAARIAPVSAIRDSDVRGNVRDGLALADAGGVSLGGTLGLDEQDAAEAARPPRARTAPRTRSPRPRPRATAATKLVLEARQSVRRHRSVRLRVHCAAACNARIGGTLRAGGRTVRLDTARLRLGRGWTRVVVRTRRSSAPVLRRALRGRGSARLTVRALVGGRATVASRTVRVL